MNEEVETDVRVVLVGDAPGVKAGGVLQQIIHDVKVSATPEKLPETIELDISSLEIGDVLTTNDLPENKDYVVQAEEEETVVTVSAPRAEEDQRLRKRQNQKLYMVKMKSLLNNF